MSSADCERWMSLSDQAAMGQTLSDREQAWLVQHARGCNDCGREADFYASLHEAAGRPEVLVLPSSNGRRAVRGSPARTTMVVALALAASVALAVGIVRKLGDRNIPTNVAQERPPTASRE